MLVRLYALPESRPILRRARELGAVIARPEPAALSPLRAFVDAEFGVRWGDGVPVAFSRQPITAFTATFHDEFAGFVLFDVANRGYLGPIGVREGVRDQGIGSALLLQSLESMAAMGYAYAVIGDVGPVDFFAHVCGATVIA